MGTYEWKSLAQSQYPCQYKELADEINKGLEKKFGKDVPTMSKEQFMEKGRELGIPTLSEEKLQEVAITMDKACTEAFTPKREAKLTAEKAKCSLVDRAAKPTVTKPVTQEPSQAVAKPVEKSQVE